MGDVTVAMPTLSSKVVLIKEETIQRGQSVFLYETVIMFFSVVNIFTWQSMGTDSFEDSLKWPLEELQFWLYFFQPGVCSLKSLLLLPK